MMLSVILAFAGVTPATARISPFTLATTLVPEAEKAVPPAVAVIEFDDEDDPDPELLDFFVQPARAKKAHIASAISERRFFIYINLSLVGKCFWYLKNLFIIFCLLFKFDQDAISRPFFVR